MRQAPALAPTLAFKSRLTSSIVWTEVSGHWAEVGSQPHALATLSGKRGTGTHRTKGWVSWTF
jgi:hypothetical protein